jgi:hypothetical protein
VAEPNVQVCPGCGGRNGARAESCDWCGRPFSERRRGSGIRWWKLAASIVLGTAVAVVVVLAVLNATRPDARPAPAAAGATVSAGPTVAAAAPEPTPTAATPAARPADPTPPPRRATITPTPPPPTATPVPPRYVRVVNTGGLGVNLRRDPGVQGQPVLAVPDNTLLRLVGPEETVQARLWRLCEHQGRNVQGWVPSDFLQPTDQVPTPGRT